MEHKSAADIIFMLSLNLPYLESDRHVFKKGQVLLTTGIAYGVVLGSDQETTNLASNENNTSP